MGLRARLCVAAHTNSRTFFFKDYVLAFYNNRTKYEENHQSEFHFVNNQVDHLFRLLIKKKKVICIMDDAIVRRKYCNVLGIVAIVIYV